MIKDRLVGIKDKILFNAKALFIRVCQDRQDGQATRAYTRENIFAI